MDQEKETKRQAERCASARQRIVRELTPASIQVLGGSSCAPAFSSASASAPLPPST